MKVAIVVNELNIRGGTHKQVLRLCQYLERKQIEFILCTKYYEQDKTYMEFKNFDILYLYEGVCCRSSAGINIVKRVRNFVIGRKEDKELYNLIPTDVDIINVHDVFLENFISLAKKKKKKVVWQINDLNPVFRVGASKSQKDSLYKKYQRIKIKNIARKVDKITVNVTKNKERVKDFLNKNATVMYCGVDRNNSLNKHLFDVRDEFVLLSMGVFFPYRNYETLISVIKSMRNQGKKIKLNIIGSTELDKKYADKIDSMIKENHMENCIHIYGQVDELVYTELFNSADAFAFINIDQSWGLAVFEAMSCGLPTIVSHSVGATELLHDGEDSIIVDPLDVKAIESIIESLMTERDYYNKISDNAYNVIQNYTWDSMYSSKMVSLFEELL